MKFSWKGKQDQQDGTATYSTAENTYELWMPTFKNASELDAVLRNVYLEGRRHGHREMMSATSNAMNSVARGELK